MVSLELMKNAVGKNVKIKFTNGKYLEEKCIQCHQPEDYDEEEYMLEFKHYLINQSEIESIEIL
ncbi:hypothetical protein [Peptostreptococcus faecalis]|uniref:hypothetical protein n=1 Tax=Peptostreptococcus faecalis TaxID=2045015 RepID=UPI000C7DA73A|nr:hypothetical protein [Peptostreptococcus faecalis]